MTEVIKIDGSPGGGKTTTLENRLRDEKRDGTGPTGFWWLNFSNAGCSDVEPVLEDIYPNAEDVVDRAKTVHGMAYSLCIRDGAIDPSDDPLIMQGVYDDDEPDPFAEFCSPRGLRYDPEASNTRKLLSRERTTDATGNNLFAINDYLRQTYKLDSVIDDGEHNKVRHAPVNIRTHPEAVARLLGEWREYKREAFDGRKYEHGDYVREAIERTLVPAVDVLLIDEFQDLAPLEYKLYKVWRDSGEIDRIYISGDENQSIYSFRGGTPYYFNGTDVGDTVTLKQSYRCPQEIARTAGAILDSHANTDPRGFAGVESGGVVTFARLRDKRDLRDAVIAKTDEYDADPSVMLLTRTNRQLRGLMNSLQRAGVPFETLGSRGEVWDGDMAQYLAFLSNWQNGSKSFVKANVRAVLEELPDGATRRKELGAGIGQVLNRSDVMPAFAGLTPTETAKRLEIREYLSNSLVNALDAPAAMSPSEVRVGTIHTAKGLEAPCVYLFSSTSTRSVKRYRRDDTHAAEEHRVYYVGATRASEELHLVDSFFNGPTAPPIRKLKTRDEVTA